MIRLKSIPNFSMYRNSDCFGVNQNASKMEIRFFVNVILVVLLLAGVLHSGEALECYNCDSRISDTCVNNPTPKETKNCTDYMCASCTYGTSNGSMFTIRDCGVITCSWRYLQSTEDVIVGDCKICKEDYCNNNANIVTISTTALGYLVSFWAIGFVLTNSY